MQRYKIKIEYEGTPFVGWQFQKNGQSIQEVLQKAIFNFSKENVISVLWHDNVLKMKGGRVYGEILEFLTSQEDVKILPGKELVKILK